MASDKDESRFLTHISKMVVAASTKIWEKGNKWKVMVQLMRSFLRIINMKWQRDSSGRNFHHQKQNKIKIWFTHEIKTLRIWVLAAAYYALPKTSPNTWKPALHFTCNHPGLVQRMHGEASDSSPGRVTVTGNWQLEPHVPTSHSTTACTLKEKSKRLPYND